MKKLLVGMILIQVIVFIALILYDSKPTSVANSPYRTIDYSIRKDSPSQAVMNQSTLLESGMENATTLDDLTKIKQKYMSLFGKLEQTTSTKLTNLMVKAFDEYQEQGTKSQSLLSMSRYYQEFKEMEQEADQEFKQLYEQLQAELVEHDYSANEADEFKKIYEQKKKEQLAAFKEHLKQQE
ncbi:hypothetical protein [Bacillus sp. PS06]|uniref:hypothetical protein n=1 Tax=Bacillus sp. PS06 TaxID=2764176 RepID=UPI001782DCA7|nr:hypothetical protein [Bacillus sp. PS06]MBD8070570.1 hypothetical protein [Bacillus sp. PS06]